AARELSWSPPAATPTQRTRGVPRGGKYPHDPSSRRKGPTRREASARAPATSARRLSGTDPRKRRVMCKFSGATQRMARPSGRGARTRTTASCRAAARGTAMKSRRALSLAGEGRPVRSDLATGSFDTPSWKPFALQERPPEQVEGGLSAPGLDGAPRSEERRVGKECRARWA